MSSGELEYNNYRHPFKYDPFDIIAMMLHFLRDVAIILYIDQQKSNKYALLHAERLQKK